MDGGLRSVSNADLAAGYNRVVVLAPSGAMDTPYDNNTRLQLEEEARALRDGGSRVAVVQPDATALEASGPNRMDIAFLRPAAEAGLHQAKSVCDRIQAVWQA
jgi:NTE family protein